MLSQYGKQKQGYESEIFQPQNNKAIDRVKCNSDSKSSHLLGTIVIANSPGRVQQLS